MLLQLNHLPLATALQTPLSLKRQRSGCSSSLLHNNLFFSNRRESSVARISASVRRSKTTRTYATTSTTSASTTTLSTLPPVPQNAHRWVLMRHGESEFNNANVFTGWCDVALTPRGVVEAVEAGQVFRSHDLQFRKCYTSLLTRSIVTAHRTLEAAGGAYTPLVYDWRLNERHYGALQGLSKEQTAVRLGRARVMKWRRSYDARPPYMTTAHPHYRIIQQDPRYRHLQQDIPLGESLRDCQHRVIEAWKDMTAEVATTMSNNNSNNDQEGCSSLSDYSLVVAHANTLRALVMHIDHIDPEEIEGLNIPTAIPFFYDIDKTTGEIVSSLNSNNNSRSLAQDKIGRRGGHFRGIYISDERKKNSFLERRRAANDPWLWALHNDQVDRSMLINDDDDDDDGNDEKGEDEEQEELNQQETIAEMEEEAKHNTEIFSSALLTARDKETR